MNLDLGIPYLDSYNLLKMRRVHQGPSLTIIHNIIILNSTNEKFTDCPPERQEPSDGHVHGCVFVPGLLGDLTGYVARATRGLEVARFVLSDDSTDDGEWEAHQHPGT